MPKLKHILKKVAKYIPAVIGTVAGTAVGGPAGGIAGGALGGASTRGKGNKLKGALKGAGLGAIYTAGAPTLFQALGGTPGSLASMLTGAGSRSLLNQIGVSSAPSVGGGLGFYGNMGQKGVLQAAGGIKGLAAKVPGGKYLLPSAMHAFGKMGAPQRSIGNEEGLDLQGYRGALVNPVQGVPLPNSQAPQGDSEESKRISDIVNNPSLSALDKLLQILQVLESEKPGQQSAQMAQNLQREEVPHEDSFEGEDYKRGGYVSGDSGGQDDDVPSDLEEGDYVMDGTTISLLGDGNSLNGAKKIKQIEDKFMRTGIVRNPSGNYRVRAVKAKISPGEYVIKRAVVDAAGGGDNKKGAKQFDEFRKNLRVHKGVKKFLPPKSKPTSHYFGKGRVR